LYPNLFTELCPRAALRCFPPQLKFPPPPSLVSVYLFLLMAFAACFPRRSFFPTTKSRWFRLAFHCLTWLPAFWSISVFFWQPFFFFLLVLFFSFKGAMWLFFFPPFLVPLCTPPRGLPLLVRPKFKECRLSEETVRTSLGHPP